MKLRRNSANFVTWLAQHRKLQPTVPLSNPVAKKDCLYESSLRHSANPGCIAQQNRLEFACATYGPSKLLTCATIGLRLHVTSFNIDGRIYNDSERLVTLVGQLFVAMPCSGMLSVVATTALY
eukprot:3914582-Amphidinium_carterae.1